MMQASHWRNQGLREEPSYNLKQNSENRRQKELGGNSVWHSSRIVCGQEVQRLKESTTPVGGTSACGGARMIAVFERLLPAGPVKRIAGCRLIVERVRPTYSLAVALR